MKYSIFVIGCQYNEYDASQLSNLLLSCGLKKSPANNADLIFVLACSVRQSAVNKMFGKIHNWQKTGKQIFVTACVLDNDKKKLKKLGVQFFNNFDELNEQFKSKAESSKLKAKSCNYVPIITGCNNFCSYCVVPYTRGREKSRPYEEVIRDVKKLIYAGQKDIVLLGQNVNSYKLVQKIRPKADQLLAEKCKNNKSDFAVLLKMINDIPGDFVFSFMSNHPKDMTDDILKAIATLPKIKKKIHLPLQSGSDKILKLMNRPYTIRQYLRLIENCKSKIENLSVTTDIIVGFPGEDEEDFQKTVNVLNEIGFKQAFINKYSPRIGTKAFELGDPISSAEKQKRWHILNKLVNTIDNRQDR
jgi:tRNA-2-methylthio-N6-dimethylallyladenosine synthase